MVNFIPIVAKYRFINSFGALITSTLLTLFAIPAMYEIIEIIRSKKEAVPVE